ncbi:MAG TPA: NYN domain-containing protein, partial [Thermoanaerobaculia bacterium]
ELAQEIRRIARRDQRWIKLASAFPVSPTYHNRRGINGTDWLQIDRAIYDRCLDPRDYRPKRNPLN